MFTMEGAAFRADNNLENDSRYFNEGIYRGYNFDVNNSRRRSSYDAFFTVNDAGVEVGIADEHNNATDFEVQVVWMDSSNVDSFKKFS